MVTTGPLLLLCVHLCYYFENMFDSSLLSLVSLLVCLCMCKYTKLKFINKNTCNKLFISPLKVPIGTNYNIFNPYNNNIMFMGFTWIITIYISPADVTFETGFWKIVTVCSRAILKLCNIFYGLLKVKSNTKSFVLALYTILELLIYVNILKVLLFSIKN